jgi:hypothetical protein
MMFEEKRIGQIREPLEEALGNIVRFACPEAPRTSRDVRRP